jgi:hypothetical protein
VFLVKQRTPLAAIIDELVLVWTASTPEAWTQILEEPRSRRAVRIRVVAARNPGIRSIDGEAVDTRLIAVQLLDIRRDQLAARNRPTYINHK